MSSLFAHFPKLATHLPICSLGDFPTPIERWEGLTSNKVELWVKREDRAGSLYGGNKVRKLEHLLGEAKHRERAEAAPRVVTLGAWGSNHALAVALYGQALGLRVDTVLFPQPLSQDTIPSIREHLLAQISADAQVWPARTFPGVLPKYMAAYFAKRGPKVVIPSGGSSPLGTLGWVSGGLEIADQVVDRKEPPFDVVYVTVGTGGTAAGLLLGLGHAAVHVRGVRVVPWPIASQWMVERLADQTERLLCKLADVRLPSRPLFSVDGRFVGPGIGYGVATPLSKQAVGKARTLGLPVETTYTGKTLAALLADADSGILDGKRVLFMLTASGADLSERIARADENRLPNWLVSAFSK